MRRASEPASELASELASEPLMKWSARLRHPEIEIAGPIINKRLESTAWRWR